MKLSPAEQKELDRIRQVSKVAGNCGSGGIDDPQDRDTKRRRKLYDAGLVLYVGCGKECGSGFSGGVGLIPSDTFDTTKHTKLSLDWTPKDCRVETS